MCQNRKILSFIFDKKTKNFLLLRNNSSDLTHGGDFRRTVTGNVEGDESKEECVIREVLEETGLDVVETFFLNWIFDYKRNGVQYREYCFFSYVNESDIVLNEESVEYQRLNLEDYISKIHWLLDKKMLNNILELAIGNKVIEKEIIEKM